MALCSFLRGLDPFRIVAAGPVHGAPCPSSWAVCIRLVPLHDQQTLSAIANRLIAERWFPIVWQKVGADTPHESMGLFNQNYAAGLATAKKKWFWEPLRPGKIPKVYAL